MIPPVLQSRRPLRSPLSNALSDTLHYFLSRAETSKSFRRHSHFSHKTVFSSTRTCQRPALFFHNTSQHKLLQSVIDSRVGRPQVDKHHYEEDLLPALESAGYTGRFKKRNTPTKVDGCAMFWKASKLTLDEYEAVNLDQGGRYNVAQVATMTHKEGGSGLCVCNTHLLFNPQRGDIKLAQVAQLLSAVRKASSSYKRVGMSAGGGGGGKKEGKRGETECAILMGGDFNFLPFSPLYRLVTSGVIVQDVKLRELSGQNRWKSVLRGAHELKGMSLGAHGGRGGLRDPGIAVAGEGNDRARRKHAPGATFRLKDVLGMAKSAILEGNSGTKFSSWWRQGGGHWLSKIGGGLMRVGVDGRSITQVKYLCKRSLMDAKRGVVEMDSGPVTVVTKESKVVFEHSAGEALAHVHDAYDSNSHSAW